MDLREPRGAVEAEEPFRLHALPIALTILLGLGISFLSFSTIEFLKLVVRLPERPEMPWVGYYYFHIVEFVYALVVIAFLKLGRRGEFGLRYPDGESYVGDAIRWGLLFGIVMTAIDFAPQLIAMHRPDQPYPLTPLNIAGWFSYQGVFVGLSEEVFFRGLLVSYLTQRLPGRVTFRGLTMNGAGVVVAVLYALSYSESFLSRALPIALGQMLYAFALGLFFAYWYEKSRSLLAPIIGHNVSAAVEQVLIFAMVVAFR